MRGGQIKAESALLVADGLLHNTGFINVKEDLIISAGEFLNEQRIAQAQQDVKIEGLFGSKRKTIYYDALQAGGDITAGNIVIVSEGDFTNLGGKIAAVGDLTIAAGGELVNQAQRWEFVVDWNQGVLGSLFGAKSYDIGVGFAAGELLSGGNLYLQADQSIQNIGSTIAALGDVTLVADELIKQDLQYASYTSYQGVKFSGFGFSFEDKKEIVTQRAETTSLTGDVTFISRGDIENRGSGITAGRDLWLQAADNVRLDALTVEVKESSWDFGFTGNGFSYNQSDWNRTKTEQSKLVSGGNTTMVAGNDVTGQAVQMYVGNDLTVAAGRDIAFEQETVNHYYNSSGWEIGVSALGAELLARAVVQGGDIFQALIDSVPGGSQIQDLANAKSGWDIADSTTQLGMTGWNALNAFGNASNPYTEGTALDGVAAVYGVDTGANGGGFNMQITVNLSNYEVRDKWTESFGTDLNVGGNVQMQAGNDLQLKGGTQVNAEGDITLVAGHDLLIEAAKDTRSHDSRTTGGKFGIDIQGGGFTVGGNGGYEEGNGDTYTYAGINAGGDLTTVSGNDTVIKGGNLYGENVYMEVGGDLWLETLQNYNKFESKNASASVTFSMAGVTGASASYGQTDAKRRWSDNVSNITGKDRVEINVGGNTNLIGSLINSESGNLVLNTETLTFKDLNDSDKLFSINVSISTNGGGGIMGGIGFSLTDDDKRGVTRATVGEGTINVRSDTDGHSLDGLNRDVTQVQEVTKDDHFGMHMTVPIIDPDQMVEEGKVVIPTAHAITASAISTANALITTPAVALFQPVLKWQDVFSPDGFNLDNFLYYPFERAVGQYDTAYKTMEHAYLYKPESMASLWASSIPLVGKFVPDPVGNMNNQNPVLFTSGGINDRDEGESKRNQATISGQGMNKDSAKSITMPFSNAFEIASELLFGSTALGYDAVAKILEDAQPGDTIAIQGHSGGVMHMMSASKILGVYDIGVGYASLSQGPFLGTFNNVQQANVFLSLGVVDPTSDIAGGMQLISVVNKNVYTSFLSSLPFSSEPDGQHNQSYWVSPDNVAQAIKENKTLNVGGNEWQALETQLIKEYMQPIWQSKDVPVGNVHINSPYPQVDFVKQQTQEKK
ncbi:MAG: hemagglutinin repeat-containing protein [Verrucomicrobiales bacterium]|nr:hemagglutinin repeat-containing protein [Verrucomicrobiales bacterium]